MVPGAGVRDGRESGPGCGNGRECGLRLDSAGLDNTGLGGEGSGDSSDKSAIVALALPAWKKAIQKSLESRVTPAERKKLLRKVRAGLPKGK